MIAGSGKGDHWKLRGRCSWSCDPAARPGVGWVWRECRESWAGRQPRAPERAPALRRASPAVGEARPAAAADRGRARAGVVRVAAAAPARAARAGFPAPPGGLRGQGKRVRVQAGPRKGHLLAPRPPLENVSGKAHVLPAGAEQDHLGGARALPEPVSGGLRRLWLRVVSVTGPGASLGRVSPYAPESGLPHGSAMHPAAGIFLGGRASQPSSTPDLHSLSPLHPHPARPRRWSAMCRTQVRGGRWVMVLEPGPDSHPARSLGGGGELLLRGQEHGSLFGGLSLLASSRRTLSRCACSRSRQARELPGEAEGQSSTAVI